MAVQFVTGTDAALFWQTVILLQSFEEAEACIPVKVCDFGLTPAQKGFLAERDQLIPIPPLTGTLHHPWNYKTVLGSLVGPGTDAIVWLDADMVVTRDPGPLVTEIVEAMKSLGQIVAACPDDCGYSLGSFLEIEGGKGRNVAPFKRNLEAHGVDLTPPYLNSGFLIATRDFRFDEWEKLTLGTEPHFLWDQSSLNVCAWSRPSTVRVLDKREWNVHGFALGRARIDEDNLQVLCEDRIATVLHATSPGAVYHDYIEAKWPLAGKEHAFRFKVFRNPGLGAIQLTFLNRFIHQNENNLAKWLNQ